jgi:hypothetical protein
VTHPWCAEGDNDEVARLLGPKVAPSAFLGRHEHHDAGVGEGGAGGGNAQGSLARSQDHRSQRSPRRGETGHPSVVAERLAAVLRLAGDSASALDMRTDSELIAEARVVEAAMRGDETWLEKVYALDPAAAEHGAGGRPSTAHRREALIFHEEVE